VVVGFVIDSKNSFPVSNRKTKMPGPADSLVKYETPVLMSTQMKRRSGAAPGPAAPSPAAGSPSKTASRGAKLPPIEAAKASSQTEDILNQILPPREWSEEGQTWVQKASPAPATRLDVMTLQDQLDAKLKERQARETGICPIRQELYAQTFGALFACGVGSGGGEMQNRNLTVLFNCNRRAHSTSDGQLC
jgi:dynein light intermediate chain